jgi:hypothetical protein
MKISSGRRRAGAAMIGAARAYAFATIGELWETLEAGREITPRQWADIQLVHTQVFGMCTEAVELLYKARGGSAVYTGNLLDRCLRDLLTMNQHVMNSLRTYGMGGRLLLGLPQKPAINFARTCLFQKGICMPYAEGRIYNDADSHLMKPTTGSLRTPTADPRAVLPPYFGAAGRMVEALGKKRDANHWETVNIEANLMNLKGWDALGAIDPTERTRALNMLGFNSQLVFPSVALSQFWGLFGQQQRDPELLYGGTRALNRAMTDFCAHDKRLLPVGFVPLDVPALAEREMEEAVALAVAVFSFTDPSGDMSQHIPHLTASGRGCRTQLAFPSTSALAQPISPAFVNVAAQPRISRRGESIRAVSGAPHCIGSLSWSDGARWDLRAISALTRRLY